MRCTRCGSENPAGARFCIECGGPLQTRCPTCGGENLPRAKFCAACGTALGVGGKSVPAASSKGKGVQTPKRAPRPKGRPTLKKPQVAASEAERLGRAHSLPFISEVSAQIYKGLAWLRAGRLAEGIAQLRQSLEIVMTGLAPERTR